ncbi:MAG: hypothetical protein IT371_26030 [Deltaproteobacteria bacterium]|nr:hypothetical protein [Deltaproteobacteria bacterium]
MRSRRLMVVFLLGAAFSPAAFADSETHYQDVLVGERAAGMGGAAIALGDEATGAYYNPAGLATDASTLVQVSMSAFKLKHRVTDLADLCGTRLTDDRGAAFSFPASLGLAKLFGRGRVRHAVGLLLVVPHADRMSQSYVARDARCGELSVDLGGSNVQVDRVLLGGLTYAIRPARWLQLGLTFGVGVRTFTAQQLVVTLGGTAAAPPSYPAVQFGSFDVALWSAYLQFGAIVEPIPRLRFGLSFTTPYLRLAGTGRYDVFSALRDPQTGLAASAVASLDDAEYAWKVPFVLGLGAAYRFRRGLVLAADVKLHGPVESYAILEHPRVPAGHAPVLERQVVVNVNAGAEVPLGKRWLGRLGAFTNLTSLPRATFAAGRAHDHLHLFGATLGVSVKPSPTSTIGLVVQGLAGTGDGLMDQVAAPAAPGHGLQVSQVASRATDLSLLVGIGGSYDLR